MKATLATGLPFLLLALVLPAGAGTGMSTDTASALPFLWAALVLGLSATDALLLGVTALPFSAWCVLYLGEERFGLSTVELLVTAGTSLAGFFASASVTKALARHGHKLAAAPAACMAALAFTHARWGWASAAAFSALAWAVSAFTSGVGKRGSP